MLYMRGSSWIGIIYSMATILTLIKVFYDYIAQYISDMWLVYGFVLVFVPTLNIMVGYADKKWGIWKKENDYCYGVTPKSDTMYNNTVESLLILQDIDKRLKELEKNNK